MNIKLYALICFFCISLPLLGTAQASSSSLSPEIQNYIDAQIKKASASNNKPPFEFGGYFRTGTQKLGSGGSKSSGSCYSLNFNRNDGAFYRFGNECRDYGEFTLSHNGFKNGIYYKAVFMLDIAGDSRSATATESWSNRSRQLYVELKGIFWDDSKLWVGRRYYRAIGSIGDIHVLDGFHVQSSGNGFGLSDVKIASTNNQFALIGYGGEDDPNDATDPEKNVQNYLLDIRSDYQYNSINSYQLAIQKLLVSQSSNTEADNISGSTLSLQWQRKFAILNNKLVLQIADGSMAENPGCFGSDGNCFNMSAKANDTAHRIISNGTFDWGSKLIIHYNVLLQSSPEFNRWNSFAIRPHYILGKYWSLVTEVSQDRFTLINSGTTANEQELNKYTVALQASLDAQNFWERPSLRFYASQFNWNDAAVTQASNVGLPASEKKQATIIGAQAEMWF